MPMERVAMRLVRDCLRLKSSGVSTREIARRIGVAPSTVRLTLRRCEAVGLVWPLDVALTDTALEQRLFANAGKSRAIDATKSRTGRAFTGR
jgi:IS30 family transposase